MLLVALPHLFGAYFAPVGHVAVVQDASVSIYQIRPGGLSPTSTTPVDDVRGLAWPSEDRPIYTLGADEVGEVRDGAYRSLRRGTGDPLWLEVDEIYNLACPAAPGHYQYNPIKTMKTSVMGAINVLGMAKRCRAKSNR